MWTTDDDCYASIYYLDRSEISLTWKLFFGVKDNKIYVEILDLLFINMLWFTCIHFKWSELKRFSV